MYLSVRKIGGIIKCLCILLVVCGVFESCNYRKAVFVATNGNDFKGEGTRQNPFKTLERARDEIRKQNDGSTRDFVVYLREGKYFLKSSFRLTEEDGAVEGATITYSAYRKEEVILHGGIEIPGSKVEELEENEQSCFEEGARTKIKKINIKSLGIRDYGKMRPVGFARPFGPSWAELFVDGKPYSLSRWPNDSTIAMGKILDPGSVPRDGDFANRGGKFTFDTNRPLMWKSHKNIWISGYFKRGWAEDAVELAVIDTKNKTFETKQPSLYGFGTGEKFTRWFVYNILEEVDQPGEFYLDCTKGILYFYPCQGAKKIEFSILETPMVSIINASNLHFKDITFECSRGMGIYMEGTHDNHIENCVFRNLGMMGICMGKGIEAFKDLTHSGVGKAVSEKTGSYLQHLYEDPIFNRCAGHDNVIENCEIYNTGAGGIHLSGGDRITLERGNNTVVNCTIHDFNRIEKSYRAGIDISGVGNRIANCELYNAPSMAILLHGNDHEIEYNEIHHVCREVHDQGALYYGRDPSERGHVVRYNFFHHLNSIHATSAVYHDDGACGMEVYGNIFYKPGKIPVLIGGGHDNPYTNNIFIDAELGIHVDNRNQNWSKSVIAEGGIYQKRLNLVNYNEPPYSTSYPNLVNYWEDNPSLPKRNTVSKNIFYKVKKVIAGNKDWLPFKDDNWITNENPGFVNEEEMNFELTKGAKAFEAIGGFETIPFGKIGVQVKR